MANGQHGGHTAAERGTVAESAIAAERAAYVAQRLGAGGCGEGCHCAGAGGVDAASVVNGRGSAGVGEHVGHGKAVRVSNHTPGPWQLHVHRFPNGKMNGAPYLYAPNGTDMYRHICEPCIDDGAPPEIRLMQEANAQLLSKAPDLLTALANACGTIRALDEDYEDRSSYQDGKALIEKLGGAL